MTVLETLKAAKEKIAEPQHWTVGALSRDRSDFPVSPASCSIACKWCAEGALASVAPGFAHEAAWKILRDQIDVPLHIYNDSHTHTQVLELFDKAIASLEATDAN